MAGIGVAGLLAGWVLPRLGAWLSVGQAPAPAACIIVLGGGPANRLTTAVRLWREGYAPVLVLSGGAPGEASLTQAQAMAREARGLGVPRDDLILDNRSQTTLQNAEDTLPILAAHHLGSALVVSSDYHMRRARFLFRHVYSHSGIRLRFVGVRSAGFDPARWWATPTSAYTTLSEYAKLAVNAVEVWWIEISGRPH